MTTRVLHLVDPLNAGWPALEALSALIDAGDSPFLHTVVLLGGASADRLASNFSLPRVARLAPPLGRAELAGPLLRCLLRDGVAPDVIHAWSAAALSLGHIACPRTPLCATLSAPPPEARWSPARPLALRAARSASQLLATSQFVLDSWTDALRGHGAAARMALLPLPISPSADAGGARSALRAQWGLADHVMAILPTGEPEARLDARWFTFRAGVLAVAGTPAAIILSPRCNGLERALRFTERHHHAWPVIVDDRPIRALLPACDIALWRAGPSVNGADIVTAHGLALCAASGVPCVAEDHPLSREVMAETIATRFVPRADSVAISRALFEIVDLVRESCGRSERLRGSTSDAWRSRMTARLLQTAGADALYTCTTPAFA